MPMLEKFAWHLRTHSTVLDAVYNCGGRELDTSACAYALIYARCAVRCDGQDDIDRASSEHTLRRRVHVQHITHAA